MRITTTLCCLPLVLAGIGPATANGNPESAWQAAADYSAAREGVSLLVMQSGEIVYENYTNGGGADVAWVMASGTKSFWGVLAAAMVQDGELDIDESVAETLTEWQSNKMKSWITVRHLLSMTSGLAGSPPGGGRIMPYHEAVTLAITHEPGSRFYYQPSPYQVFGEMVLRKVEGRYRDPVEYLQARLFDPLGIEPEHWARGPDDYPRIPNGAHLTARDWATWGEFIRLGGTWEGEQLVDPEALAANFVGSEANPAYGLGWWLPRDVSEEVYEQLTPNGQDLIDFVREQGRMPNDLIIAAGAGNQRMYVIPSLEMVVVRQQVGSTRAERQRRRGRDALQYSDVEFLEILLGT